MKKYITTQELAIIRGVSTRAIRKSIKAKNYVARKNGKSYEILIASLEPYIQEKIWGNYVIANEEEINVTESEKKLALAKFDFIQEFRKFRLHKKSATIKDFLILYRTNIKYVYLYDLLGNVSISSIYRWDNALKSSNDNWKSLVNTHTIKN